MVLGGLSVVTDVGVKQKILRFRNSFGRSGNAVEIFNASEEWRHWGILISESCAAVCQCF